MENESGKSKIMLVILTILIIIGISVIANYAQKMVNETKEQDIKTNMLLMQVETKKGLEEVCRKIVNLDTSKEENLTKINEIKNEFLKGKKLGDSPSEVQEAVRNVPDVTFDENCYYLDETTLKEIGIKKVDESSQGYFIVKYDFSNVNVEVINTNGFDGNYTLTQVTQDIENE